MSILNILNTSGNERNKGLYKLLTTIVVIAGIFLGGNFLFPKAISVILNIIWIILITVVVVFFALGILVVIGLKKEASKILDVLLEGSLTFIDLLDFLKLVYHRFIEILKDFAIYIAPVIAYIFTFVLYIGILVLYKTVGKTQDVTLLTIFLTIILVFAVGFLTKPKKIEPIITKWTGFFKHRFHHAFTDGVEVILFIFFLTMDSTQLFFLPEDLRVELHAKFFQYNLMTRSFIYNDHLKFTVTLIVIAITIDIVRNILRVIASARRYYSIGLQSMNPNEKISRSQLIKKSLRQSFVDTKDDLVRFIIFSTVLFAVFLLFPRLKILTLVVASASNLILDILIPLRLFHTRGTDLISRILAKVFRL
jgi:hypothetical protein